MLCDNDAEGKELILAGDETFGAGEELGRKTARLLMGCLALISTRTLKGVGQGCLGWLSSALACAPLWEELGS